ncbi:MAG: hypothetical protein A3E82_08950 [Gammaproteobacteria bacterium RIFCSPHIGHO2_12_FULL_38_11]|nr:MAG: hypothetical protein A3E82_08950 [Gammaproteobacteria bacterium RIFCSPHIGHO2_12_FULL_38_11]
MRYKKFLIAGFAAVLASAVTTAVMADDSGLTLKSTGVSSAIKMSCLGLNLPSFFQIQPNSEIDNISWSLVSLFIPAGTPYTCHFTLEDSTRDLVGTAVLELQTGAQAGEISNIHADPSYVVNVTPAQGVYDSQMTLAISKV